MTDISTKSRRIVHKRSGNCCELCGTRGVLHMHHRRPRALGGSTDLISDLPSNLLHLHWRCHEKIEAKRQWAVDNGYLVAQGVDPATVPVMLFDGFFSLGRHGEVTPCERPLR